MVNLVFCGPGGSGKHKLIDEIRRRCKQRLKNHRDILHVARKVLDRNHIKSRQDFNCNDRKYKRIIREIIEEQCVEEDLYTSGEFITDNCVINALVSARRCIGGNIVEDIVEGNALLERSLSRYRSSLVVLVGPCHYVHDDMMGLKLKPEDWDARKKAYTCLFHQYKIPYINVTTTELTERSNILSEALGGKLSLETSQLEFYNPKLKPEDQEVQTTFSFYLPRPKREQSICIPTIKITEHKYELDWTEFKNGETNRFIARHGHERLSCLEFNINVRSSIAQKVMLNGITINGDVYSFIGCSSNGLKRRKCYMWKGSSDDVKSILQGNGDFEQIKTVSKRMARVGLLFSGVTLTQVTVGTDDIVSAEDIMFNGHNFSDGCGGIGTALAKTVFEQICDSGHDENYLPSVYQIRFQGFKGVLALDRALPSTKILVRPSMKKFRTDQHSSIGVCGYSRAYTFGHLNKQFILLLSGLGVPDDVFEQKQKDHLEMIDNMRTNSEIAMRMLQAHNEFHLALLIARVGCIELLPEYYKTVVMRCIRRIQEKMISKLTKLDLLIPESRNLFGICDTSDNLDYGECFLRLTVSGKPMTVRGQVVVCKNPSYLLGDIRVLTAVDDTDKAGLSELNHLVDCIVFPSRGKRPHSAEIAGSDLDGDQYFVSWDTAIIPRKTRPPYDYPGAVVKEQGIITHQSMLSYFSKQNETQKMTGRVDKYFNKWADIKNVTCTECERLGQLFSRIVDANKSGEEVDIPLGLDPREVNESEGDRYVWQRMKSNAIEFEEKLTTKIIDERDKQDEISTEFVMEIVSNKHSNITEFEKFKFFWYHARRFNQSEEDTVEVIVENIAHHINFASFGIAERREAIEVGVPVKYVTNALNTSYILSENDLKHFQMDSPLNKWCRYAALEVESFDWSHLYKTLTTNDRALVVLSLPDDVILELQFLERLEKGIEQNVKSGTISSVFYSKQFDYKYRYILGPEYILDLTEDTLQLYRDGKKNLTFVWLKATDRKMTKRRWNKRVSDEVVNSLSVDLQRFDKGILNMSRRHPLINKMPFVQIEIYAQNLDGTVPYWDTFDVSDILPVPQEVEEETETEEDINRDFESLFPKLSFEEDISDENIFNEALQNTAQKGNPFLFKSILDKWHYRYSFPVDSARMFIKLLENIAVMIVPVVLPENIQTLLIELTVEMACVLNKSEIVISAASALSKLHLDDVVHQLVRKQVDTETTIEDFICTIARWELFWNMNSSFVKLFLQQLSYGMTESESQYQQTKYLRYFSTVHVLSLLQEMDMYKGKLQPTECRRDGTVHNEQTQTCIMYLKLDRTADDESGTIAFYRTGALENRSRLCQGQFVAITRQCDLEAVYPSHKAVCCVGQIQTLRPAPFTVIIKVEGEVPEIIKACLKSDGFRYWRLDLIGNITTFVRVVAALKHFTYTPKTGSLMSYISHPQGFKQSYTMHTDSNDDGDFPGVGFIHSENEIDVEGLNEKQKEAVYLALGRNICLIQGPPGTGKTKVACNIIKEVVGMKKYKGVLIVAETNVAVDNITQRLRNDMLVVRLGSMEGIASDLYDVSLEGQVKLIADREAKRTKVRDKHGDTHRNTRLINKVLSAADVVLATCAGAGESALESYTFEFVLVDEATQTMETTLLCSLAHGAKHLVMIGDHKQLGPTISSTPDDDVVEGIPDVSDLAQSLFHRLIVVKEIPSCFLDTQHRMHPELMKFPSTEFYEDKLQAAGSTLNSRVIFPWPCTKPYRPLCFINVDGKEMKRGTSYCNLKEIEVVQKVVDVLLKVHEEMFREFRLGVNHIGILTLYQGQVMELKKRVTDSVTVSSVDGFQGQEKEVIIVSTVRCNDRAIVGFSGDAKRINVLLTRAKKGLIVIGNAKTLEGSELWSRWINQAPTLSVTEIAPVSKESTLVNERKNHIR